MASPRDMGYKDYRAALFDTDTRGIEHGVLACHKSPVRTDVHLSDAIRGSHQFLFVNLCAVERRTDTLVGLGLWLACWERWLARAGVGKLGYLGMPGLEKGSAGTWIILPMVGEVTGVYESRVTVQYHLQVIVHWPHRPPLHQHLTLQLP